MLRFRSRRAAERTARRMNRGPGVDTRLPPPFEARRYGFLRWGIVQTREWKRPGTT